MLEVPVLAWITQRQTLDTGLYPSTAAYVLKAIQPVGELDGGLNPFHAIIVSRKIRIAR